MISSLSSVNRKVPVGDSMEKYLIVTEGCPSCEFIEERFKDEIEKGEMQLINANTDEDFKVAEKLGIDKYPSLIICETKDGVRECHLIDQQNEDKPETE